MLAPDRLNLPISLKPLVTLNVAGEGEPVRGNGTSARSAYVCAAEGQ